MQIVIGIVLIIAAIFLIVSVLMQSSKNHNLSGTIAGGAETFFGKTKASTMEKKLSKLTTVVAIIFCVLVLISYLLQDTTNYNSLFDGSGISIDNTASGDTTTDEADTTDAAEEADTTEGSEEASDDTTEEGAAE